MMLIFKLLYNFFNKLTYPWLSFFRYLEVTDLLSMMEVDVKWGVLIDSDPILRRRLSRAKAAFRKIPKENRDSKTRRTLSKTRHLRISNIMNMTYLSYFLWFIFLFLFSHAAEKWSEKKEEERRRRCASKEEDFLALIGVQDWHSSNYDEWKKNISFT